MILERQEGGKRERPTDLLFYLFMHLLVDSFFFKDFIYLFLERKEGKEKGGEKHQCVVSSHEPPTGDLACNPGMCPDWESNRLPSGLQACAQSTEPHQPGLLVDSFMYPDQGSNLQPWHIGTML